MATFDKKMNTLPKVEDYRILLHKAVETFNISFENARMKYGKFTYQDWENLFLNVKTN